MKNSSYGFIIGAAMLWGTTGTSQALAPDTASPLTVGALRLVIGGLALLAIALLNGNPPQFWRWQRKPTLFAGLSVALYQLCFFAGVKLTGVAVGTLIGLGSAPIFAGILGKLYLDETLSRHWLIATALAILGGSLLALSGNEDTTIDLLGVLLSIGAGLTYAIFTLTNKILIQSHSSDAVMASSFCLGAVFLSPLLLLGDITWVATSNGALAILHLGLIATGLSYVLFGKGLQTVPISITGTLTLTEPLTATLLGVLLLGERLSALGIMGVALLFIGLGLIAVSSR